MRFGTGIQNLKDEMVESKFVITRNGRATLNYNYFSYILSYWRERKLKSVIATANSERTTEDWIFIFVSTPLCKFHHQRQRLMYSLGL
jgi:hypothetical protein